MHPFLTARWTNLINITYAVPPELLLPCLPDGVELDTVLGKAFVSVVPFDFTDARLHGIKVPFHVNFPEINFRFYVKQGGKRGVIFLKEFIPKFLIKMIANTFYYERYEVVGLKSRVKKKENEISVKHCMRKGGKNFCVEVCAENNLVSPAPGSREHFFEERFYGFSKNKKGEPLRFKVEHPSWKLYPVKYYSIDVDFGFLFGKEWKFLNNEMPVCVMLLDGSAVKMLPHRKLSLDVVHLPNHEQIPRVSLAPHFTARIHSVG